MASVNQDDLGQQVEAEQPPGSWDHKSQAILYDPSLDKFETVNRKKLNSE